MEPGMLALYEGADYQGGAEFTVLGLSDGRGNREGTRSFRLDAGGSEGQIESLAECGGGLATGRGIPEPD